jgi:DNA-binding XRE family transcriptional regulator
MEVESADALLGRQVIADGRLQQLREDLGLTRSTMAEYMGVDRVQYTRWEVRAAEVKPWNKSAVRVGRFYTAATRQLAVLSEAGVNLSELLPFMVAAPLLGLTQEGLLHKYRNGEVEAVEMGVLGLWMQRDVFEHFTR